MNLDHVDLNQTKGKLSFKEEVNGKGCLLPLSQAEDLRAKVAMMAIKPTQHIAGLRAKIKLNHEEEELPSKV